MARNVQPRPTGRWSLGGFEALPMVWGSSSRLHRWSDWRCTARQGWACGCGWLPILYYVVIPLIDLAAGREQRKPAGGDR